MRKYILLLLISVAAFSSCKKEEQEQQATGALKLNFDGGDYKVQVYKLSSEGGPQYKTVTIESGKQVYAEPLELIESKGQASFSGSANLGVTYMMDVQKAKSTTLKVDAYLNDEGIKSWSINQETNREILYLYVPD
ncbi:hypothetical protein B0I27_10777 [Arcticibacter pallidicorallinus]|uniref:Lipoprotein n=1 Tax=Arcticibacter pallidicorallinus TaxID=1259464 RepID=A0A2T0U0R3_9SPHI|nr:hypothetical protein [Arcticibacter pallidicorallinus]PRY51492.1 hypothetical protein B0I27_10777 [Arcticibacter pallidicorallinus]